MTQLLVLFEKKSQRYLAVFLTKVDSYY